MKQNKLHIITFLVLLIVGCNPQPESKQLLQQAQQLVDTHPDSAMHLIDSIFYPDASLNRKSYMEFLVTQVQAKYKTYRPVAEDTLIFIAKDYFTKHNNDPSQTALAWFYSGCVYREQQRFDQTMQHYKEAEQYASKTENADLKVLIKYNMGDLLTGEGLHRQALTYYSESAEIYSRSFGEMYKKRATCLAAMGRMYLLLEQPDSAFLYFQKGLDIAENSSDDNLQSLLTQNLSVMYKELKEYEKSELYLRQSFELNQDSTALPRYYLNFAEVYSGMNRKDLAIFYADKLEESLYLADDNSFKLSAYNFLSNRKKDQGDYPAALNYKKERERFLIEMIYESRDKTVYDVQQKYDYELLKNQYQYRKNSYRLWIIILLLVIIMGITSFSWFTIRQKNKLIHVQQQANILKGIASDLRATQSAFQNTKNEDIRNLLLWRLDIIKKSVLLEEFTKSDRKSTQLVNRFYKIIYGDGKTDHWKNILLILEQLNPGISSNIKRSFPDLTESEFKITILTYAEMTVKDISIILDLSPNTVQTYRNRLRKKLKIEDSSVDTLSFLKEKLG